MKKKDVIGSAALVVLVVAAIPRPLVGSSYKLDYVEYQGETELWLYASIEKGDYSIRDGESLRAALETMLAR